MSLGVQQWFRRGVAVSLFVAALAATKLPGRAAEPANSQDSTLAPLVELLASVDDAEFQLDLLRGMRDGLKGRKSVAMPAGWKAAYEKLSVSDSHEVRKQARLLAVAFDDPRALSELRTIMLDAQAPREAREAALQALVEKSLPDLPSLLHKLVTDPVLCGCAIRGLAAFDDAATPEVLIATYPRLGQAEKQDAITALVGRVAYARALLGALEANRVPVTDVTAYTARQLLDLGDEEVAQKLRAVWGDIRPSSANKKQLFAEFKARLTPDVLEKADLATGRLVFQKSCQQCHRLYGEGATIGPDLTGSNRANLDYILENALDPSAVIGRDYRLTNIVLDDGRLLSGIVVEETERSLTVQTINQRIVLDKQSIDEVQASPVSMMPEGQLEKMQPNEVRDLVAYLASKEQVALPAVQAGQEQSRNTRSND